MSLLLLFCFTCSQFGLFSFSKKKTTTTNTHICHIWNEMNTCVCMRMCKCVCMSFHSIESFIVWSFIVVVYVFDVVISFQSIGNIAFGKFALTWSIVFCVCVCIIRTIFYVYVVCLLLRFISFRFLYFHFSAAAASITVAVAIIALSWQSDCW